jgi:hypothetical protein
VVEGSSLENCRTGNCTEGSNPSLSAISFKYLMPNRSFIGIIHRLWHSFTRRGTQEAEGVGLLNR